MVEPALRSRRTALVGQHPGVDGWLRVIGTANEAAANTQVIDRSDSFTFTKPGGQQVTCQIHSEQDLTDTDPDERAWATVRTGAHGASARENGTAAIEHGWRR